MPYTIKEQPLEYIFTKKYNAEDPQKEIPFTSDEVAAAIVATGRTVPGNLYNFVKDLVRGGNSDPRSPTARKQGYYLMEGNHSTSMGIFFRVSEPSSKQIAIKCPADLKITKLEVSIPNQIIDIIRTDEGGLLSVLSHTTILADFLKYESAGKNTKVYTVQIPVKVQPHEIDGLFLLVNNKKQRILIACEAKSQRNDSIMLNQVIGVTAGALERIVEKDITYVIPLGAKVLVDGTILLVSFQKCQIADKDKLNSLITLSTIKKMGRYLINPTPDKWIPKTRNPSGTKQLPLEGFVS